jgi:hypothetical protein
MTDSINYSALEKLIKSIDHPVIIKYSDVLLHLVKLFKLKQSTLCVSQLKNTIIVKFRSYTWNTQTYIEVNFNVSRKILEIQVLSYFDNIEGKVDYVSKKNLKFSFQELDASVLGPSTHIQLALEEAKVLTSN